MSKRNVILLALLLILSSLSQVGLGSSEVSAEKRADGNDDHYEIYPLPQNEKNLGTEFSITEEVNIVVEDTIDDPTRNFLQEILGSKSLHVTISDAVVSDKTNVIIGTRNSNGYVDRYFTNNIAYDDAIFDEIDPYVLTMDKELEDKGTIAILGKDTDAAFYALASLKMIFDQIPGKEIHSMMYEDYSDTKWRGFIEGFYGFPWSHESRISLMEYGKKLKMNAYIFGPKNDKYHNQEWRKLYPEDKLAKIEELATVGNETKTRFIWAIHPGFNMINWDDYENELDTLLNKFEQLYSVGVRQFGLFMDDISTSKALENKDKHVKLITDVANWVASKGDVKPLVYTPPFYNQAWTGETGKPYLRALSKVPENVEIMWTGSGVVGTVNEKDMQWPKKLTGRDPLVWLNWPVNDYVDSRLMLGKGEVLKPGTHNIAGVVSNPMIQAELSKIALFAVADFTWNVDDFDDDQSWKDSFKYIAPDAASELETIAHHLSDPSPSSHGLVLGESENIKKKLSQFTNKFQAGDPVDGVGEQLIDEFDHVLDAISGFREKSPNEEMVKEIDPWLNSLQAVAKADKQAVKAVIALQHEDMNKAWEELGKASDSMAKSKTFTIEKLNYPDVTVEAGAKRLVPFAENLINQLDAKILTAIDPGATANIPITSYERQDMGNMVDGDEETYAYVKIIQENGDWYGVDLGKTVKVNDIRILQGRNDGDHDIFQKGILEYSVDGENWETIGDEQTGYLVEADDLDVEARYIRYRLTHAGVPGGKPDLWTAVREFTINANKDTERLYTNVEALKDTDLQTTDTSAKIKDISDITLEPGQYIGIALKTIEQIEDIELESTNQDLSVEVSENGIEWEKITADSYPNAAYVRIVNNTEEDITFDLNKFIVKLHKFAEPAVTHNYPSVYQGKLGDVYDGDLNSKVWFGGMQDAGNYVQIDMGGIVNVENVAVVINDGEGDFFREGNLQISVDGETWKTIHTFDHPEDRSLNFPDHEVPYRYKRVQVDGEQARYIRLLSTADNDVWLALNEIIVNEGSVKPGNEDFTIQANPKGMNGYEAWRAKDQKLSTYYTPRGDEEAGHLTYKLVKETEIDDVIILQNPKAISNAKVSVRDEGGWHQVGQLSKSLQTIDTSAYDHVLEIKLEWDGFVKPQIHEIIPVTRQEPVVNSVDDIAGIVKQLEKDDAFKNQQVVHALQLHLKAVKQYEKQEDAVKVIKHMNGFKTLLDYQKENNLISEKAYKTLYTVSDAFIEQWQ
ncbi:hypothetical protein CFK37_08530 [Virgibacillus phasianinus]|uniref:Beta-N-acetylhexosaminidase n=1 Tax=Virgibacillus phasianinus TaxID=2017483 RepID=A0A220U2K3_9BACI|nr:beta-N-acetylglucosaminidase domain-containing protein [Virgibacillus phasianinus]ASK62202.1 hypothetical protein CFK37_08530 [Virgibacillus phasianinus]